MLGSRTCRPDFSNLTVIGFEPYWLSFERLQLAPFFYLRLPRAELLGGRLVVERGGRIVLESSIFQQEYLDKLQLDRLVLTRPLRTPSLEPAAVPLGNYLDRNYFHWLLEGLPRVALLPEDVWKTHRVLLSADAPNFAVDSLRCLLGVDETRIERVGAARVQIQDCLVPAFPHTRDRSTSWTNVYRPEAITRLNRLGASVAGTGIDLGRRVLLCRAAAGRRRLVPDGGMTERLRALGFISVDAARLHFGDQVRLFREAEAVVAPHGAGLANLVFARNCIVIELFPIERAARDAFYFAQISASLRLRHYIIACESESGTQDIVMTHALAARLNRILSDEGIN